MVSCKIYLRIGAFITISLRVLNVVSSFSPGYSAYQIKSCQYAVQRQFHDVGHTESDTVQKIIEKLDLHNYFGRYRLIQKLMDGDIENVDDINVILSFILRKNDFFIQDASEPFQPIMTPFGRAGDEILLSKLEQLLPTMEDNEDAHKGMWDTLIEIHGRESVKINKDKDKDWDSRCLVCLLLIVHDFVQEGVK